MTGSQPHVRVPQLEGPKEKTTRLTVPHDHAYLCLLYANILYTYLFPPQIWLKLVSRHRSYLTHTHKIIERKNLCKLCLIKHTKHTKPGS